jgi:ribosomal protein S18 acetylase RimI-like enzyme
LASPAYCASEVAVWETDREELAAFAVWQPAFKMLDYGIDPGHGVQQVGDRLIDWIESSFQQAATRSGPLTCWLNVAEPNREIVPLLDRRGFTRCAWSLVHLERSPDPTPLELPDGFSIRAGAGIPAASWAELHRSVFPRVGMSAEWRTAMMRSTRYRGELDVVAISSDDRAVAFCGAWAGERRGERACEIEPLGAHPDYRGLRLGRAVLQEIMNRMAAQSIDRVFVEPWDDNALAVHAYESLGFRTTHTIPTFAKQYA